MAQLLISKRDKQKGQAIAQPSTDMEQNTVTKSEKTIAQVHRLCDTLDTQTITECKETFAQLEEELQEHKESSPRTYLIRACCDLLRRVNSQVDPEFAGRILIFLARLLPIFDPSGYNDTEFNFLEIHKYTAVETQDDSDKKQLSITDFTQDDLHDDIEEGETIDGEEEQPLVKSFIESDEKLSERFWKLQEYLRNPMVLFEKSTWFLFRSHIDALLSMFEANPTSVGVWCLTSNYLIEPRSLARLLRDGNLRRCFLVQVLIIFKWLATPNQSKFKRENQKLDKSGLIWIDSTSKRIHRVLSNTPKDDGGEAFDKYINHVLLHEEQWVSWMSKTLKERSEDYPKPMDDEPVRMRSTYKMKRNIGEELRSAEQINMHLVGSKELNKLWNYIPDNWEACKSSERINVPSLKDFFEKASQSSPEQRKEIFKDPSFNFRALRLLSRQSNDFITPSSAVIVEIDTYLSNVTDVMCKKGFN